MSMYSDMSYEYMKLQHRSINAVMCWWVWHIPQREVFERVEGLMIPAALEALAHENLLMGLIE